MNTAIIIVKFASNLQLWYFHGKRIAWFMYMHVSGLCAVLTKLTIQVPWIPILGGLLGG